MDNSDSHVGGFVFYRSFRDAIKQLPRKYRLEMYEAITDYALDGKLPALDGIAKVVWTLMQPTLDHAKKTTKPSPPKRGAPKGNANARKAPLAKQVQPAQPTQQAYTSALKTLKGDEIPPVHREIAAISADKAWIESICRLTNMQPLEITPYLSLFRLECETTGKLSHDNLNDCKQHFKSWLRKLIERKKKNEQPEKLLRRRNDVPDVSTADYHTAL